MRADISSSSACAVARKVTDLPHSVASRCAWDDFPLRAPPSINVNLLIAFARSHEYRWLFPLRPQDSSKTFPMDQKQWIAHSGSNLNSLTTRGEIQYCEINHANNNPISFHSR